MGEETDGHVTDVVDAPVGDSLGDAFGKVARVCFEELMPGLCIGLSDPVAAVGFEEDESFAPFTVSGLDLLVALLDQGEPPGFRQGNDPVLLILGEWLDVVAGDALDLFVMLIKLLFDGECGFALNVEQVKAIPCQTDQFTGSQSQTGCHEQWVEIVPFIGWFFDVADDVPVDGGTFLDVFVIIILDDGFLFGE